MSKTNTVNYTANDRAIVEALKNASKPMTLAEINEATGLELKPGSLSAAVKKGLIAKGNEVKVLRDSHREVSTFTFVTADVLKNGDKAYNYTDSEVKILAAAATLEGEFTLAELSDACGITLKSGNINSLVKKGNLAKAGTRKVPCKAPAKVFTYVFVADIPEA